MFILRLSDALTVAVCCGGYSALKMSSANV
jgi:hypothetical protein